MLPQKYHSLLIKQAKMLMHYGRPTKVGHNSVPQYTICAQVSKHMLIIPWSYYFTKVYS